VGELGAGRARVATVGMLAHVTSQCGWGGGAVHVLDLMVAQSDLTGCEVVLLFLNSRTFFKTCYM